MSLDLTEMKVPVSADNAVGNNEEYSPLFLTLEELATGVMDNIMGDSVVEGRDPDWSQLRKNCLELWKTTRDLRVAVYLAMAEFSVNGLAGFADAIDLVDYLVTDLWDNVYPQLDPDDDNDPVERFNALSILSPMPGSYNDPIMFLSHFRMQKLVSRLKYTLRDLMIASGDLDAADEQVDPALLTAEMHTVPPSEMKERLDTVNRIVATLKHISATLEEKCPDAISVAFDSLHSELKILAKFYGQFCVENDAAAEENPADGAKSEEGAAETDQPQAAPAARKVSISDVRPTTRAEALMLLQRGAEYFQRTEPTSPVPFLVQRAVRMANMNFLELLGDIEPNAVEKGREILGVKESSGSDESN